VLKSGWDGLDSETVTLAPRRGPTAQTPDYWHFSPPVPPLVQPLHVPPSMQPLHVPPLVQPLHVPPLVQPLHPAAISVTTATRRMAAAPRNRPRDCRLDRCLRNNLTPLSTWSPHAPSSA
jgi:hypothetical protein